MTDSNGFQLPPENKERVMRLTQDVFVPNLQKAVEEGSKHAPFTEVLSAASTAYANLVEMTVGREAAVMLLRNLADHMETRPVEQPIQ
ncbi:hypothetical protein [Aureimonas sp. AU20]|uniref:hypothetical protein n=1 Tax=Aureimonas sp. AU20 TaxID=1349819 RepID=UPI00072123E6|nr:hypothetical protein [Aureimonas sp. AU20]ALN75764.1 hypothetical protein M673_23715 [Aureimonas sp. AU20]